MLLWFLLGVIVLGIIAWFAAQSMLPKQEEVEDDETFPEIADALKVHNARINSAVGTFAEGTGGEEEKEDDYDYDSVNDSGDVDPSYHRKARRSNSTDTTTTTTTSTTTTYQDNPNIDVWNTGIGALILAEAISNQDNSPTYETGVDYGSNDSYTPTNDNSGAWGDGGSDSGSFGAVGSDSGSWGDGGSDSGTYQSMESPSDYSSNDSYSSDSYSSDSGSYDIGSSGSDSGSF